MWLCQCDCGTVRPVNGGSLRRHLSSSCGCLSAEKRAEAARSRAKHHGKGERLYAVWIGMKNRCNNPHDKHYPDYGGRGIKLCEEWSDYSVFRQWAMLAGYDPLADKGECTIERVNNDAGYSPENCIWASSVTQCNNRRNNRRLSFNGEEKTLSEWAREIGIRKDTLRRRICEYGWSVERALTEPVHS